MDDSPTHPVNTRVERNGRVGIAATLIDKSGNMKYDCLILDATFKGCRVYCDNLKYLSTRVGLLPELFPKPIEASIKWRNGATARLTFKLPAKLIASLECCGE